MLSLLSSCGNSAHDLIKSNPALAFALASNWIFHSPQVQRPLRSARSLLSANKSQKDILAWLGFPGTESTRKTLAKVVKKSITIQALLYLRRSLFDPLSIKAIRHLRRLNAGVIRVITEPRLFSLTTPTLLDEIALSTKEDRFPKSAYLLRDILEMDKCLNPSLCRLCPIRSLEHLQDIHEKLIFRINQSQNLNVNIFFPDAPLGGSKEIVPITTAQGLVEEGRIQHNCVASFIERVALGKCFYVYKVTGPERSTLAIRRVGRKWVLAELKSVCNQPSNRKTRRMVTDWLANNQ
jgi:hypothetical protein